MVKGSGFKSLSIGDRVTFEVVIEGKGPADANVTSYKTVLLANHHGAGMSG